jgi:hypothetical protein
MVSRYKNSTQWTNILTEILPIEVQIHIKALTFFNNVCHQGEQNTEKKLARRQLAVKAHFAI